MAYDAKMAEKIARKASKILKARTHTYNGQFYAALLDVAAENGLATREGDVTTINKGHVRTIKVAWSLLFDRFHITG